VPDIDPCTHLTGEAPDGARLTACAHGGQLLGWRPAGGVEQLWLSPLARCGHGEAIRGGVPVIFPQFSGRGPLPKHGFGRDRSWHLDVGPGRIRAELRDSDASRALWPQEFTLRLDAAASRDTLSMELTVRNDGLEDFSFSAALHTYLAAGPGAQVHGLDGASAEDNAAGGALVRLPSGPLDALGRRDVAVRDHDGPVVLTRPNGAALTLQRDGFADVVVWHPGDDHGLGDVPGPQAPGFVCLEPAQLTPVHLEPGGSWRGVAVMTLA
jgi:glucose-6-phosphate 1-epimerase